MLRRLLSYLLLGSLPLLMSTCSSNCKDQLFTNEFRAYFLDFKEGSYWIYQNINNGDIDSLYLVSQRITRDAKPRQFGVPTCYQEYAGVKFLGIANSLRFGYYITSWSNSLESNDSDVVFEGDYNLKQSTKESFGGKAYDNVIRLENCCMDRNCYACKEKYFRFLRLYFAPEVGLVRWEAENHPQYGNAVYELVRYNAIR